MAGDDKTEGGEVYEMLWDCKHCGSTKLLGLSHRHCPNCGAPQNAEGRYFPSDAEKVRVENHVFFGKDIECRYCQAYNGRRSKHCRECGSPLSEGADGQVLEDVTHAEETYGGHDGSEPGVVTNPAKKGRSKVGVVVVGALLAFVALVVVAVTWKKDGVFEVTGQRWERAVEVEQFGPVKASDWCDSLPEGAKKLRSYRAVRSREKVADGEDCRVTKVDQGDGTMREKKECEPRYKSKPVEDDKCDYEVNSWSVIERAASQGQGSAPAPHWPPVDTGPSCNRVGCKRLGDRREKYLVELQANDGDSTSCEFDEQRWRGFANGQRYAAKVGVIGGSPDCSSLQRK